MPTQTVLLVEDDRPIRELYTMKLRFEGFEVAEAANGVIGLSLAEQLKPGLILLDLLMPEMNGEELLAKIRATDWGSNIRVIILTNLSKDEAPSSLRFLRVDRYIVKAHYTPKQVVEIVREVLGE